MNETFHPFPKLPAELRLCIWEMTVRSTGPDRSGVHFFGIQQYSKDSSCCFTTLPVFPQISQRPWKQKNPSSYFSDFGVWMACKESRAVVTSRLYDASWSFSNWTYGTLFDMRNEEGPRGAFLRALDEVIECNLDCCLYLIQYGTKTKPGKSTVKLFYGDGFHLALADEDDVEVEGPSAVMNAWDFMYEVNNWGDSVWEDRGDAVDWHCFNCLHVSVLVYEEA
ncbi:hypothetical protein ColTof3_08685 [Colletotrichum tofieldiae]|nr:hypothetical protein ColTof3_08685 [Colletotrichum tofieldiae]GKT96871.1 hypothetical protein Ct61P_14721 [Colletotrichum tofieldiae]